MLTNSRSDEVLTNEQTANRLLRVSVLRERQAQNALAQAQATVAQAKAELASLEVRREAAQALVRESMAEAVRSSELEWMSRALLSDDAAIRRAQESINTAAVALEGALAVYREASKKRMVAEKYRDSMRRARLQNVSSKQDRSASDRAGRARATDTSNSDPE